MKVKELTKKQELIIEQNLIWVFGFPNFAVTLLSKQLVGDKNNFLNKPQICRDPGSIKLGVHGARTALEWRTDPDYFFSQKFSETWKFYLRKLILHRIYSQFPNFTIKTVINEPEGIGVSSIISKTLSYSKIIFLIQEDLDSTIDSFTNEVSMDKTKLPITTLFEMDKKEIRKVVTNRFQKFKEVIDNVCHQHHENLRYVVKFEDLKKDPLEELRKVYHFAELEIRESKLEELITKYNFHDIIKEGIRKKGKTPS